MIYIALFTRVVLVRYPGHVLDNGLSLNSNKDITLAFSDLSL